MAHCRAVGPWPLQILFIGCGVAVGTGMTTHDLALPGHLARMLAEDTRRGVAVDVVVDPEMTPTSALSTLSRVRLSHYDAIVILLGEIDSTLLSPIDEWTLDLRRLLAHLSENTPTHNEVFLVSLPTRDNARTSGKGADLLADRHARLLNSAMVDVCGAESNTIIVRFTDDDDMAALDRRSTESYRQLAHELVGPIAVTLNRVAGSSDQRVDVTDEEARQRTVTQLGILDEAAIARLDRIAELAQHAFGTKSAAVTIIDGPWQIFASRRNIEMTRIPRRDAFCSLTILGREALVIPDASIDPRFSDNELVFGETHVRFYAGYPIEAPNGERIGSLCVLHDEPMQFTEENLIQLRTLALFAQDELWSEGYRYEREFGQRTGDDQARELMTSIEVR